MTTIVVKRPKDPAAIRRLIRERERNIERLEAALALSLPAQDRRHLQNRLKGERANLQSWIDYLSKQQSKRSAA